jgi:glucarate dehydratase
MRISAIRATPVSVPLAAPLRHANGCHWGASASTRTVHSSGKLGIQLANGGYSADGGI